jgi:hypothetical protein
MRTDEARDALRSSRLDQAFAFYQVYGPEAFDAEDFFALGSALLERQRLVLGWAALEAARRIDPKHVPSVRALDDLQAKQTIAPDGEKTTFREAGDAVEFLRGVRGGPPLGTLVLGLARYAGDRDRDDGFLDRLLILDRAVLRAVATMADAIKLIARLLLESGRAAEARDLLRPLVAGVALRGLDGGSAADRPPKSPVVDHEAAWLLSRTALQLGQHEAADALLEAAAGFGKGDHPSPEPSPYAGSKSCALCHLTTYRIQQRDSAHAKTIYFGSDLKDVPLPAQPVADPVAPGVTHHFRRRADGGIELQTHAKDQVVRALIEYAVGSGRHGITMVGKDEPSGVDRELRVSYFAADQSWGETKGISFLPHDPGDYIGLGLSSKALRQCLQCHTTWFRVASPLPSSPSGPEAQDHGIGCERCHGPGLNHIKAVESGFAEIAIAQTRHTASLEHMRSCNECHASNGSVEPNDPEFTRVQGTTLMFSRCFTGTKGAIHCATCHDPHRNLDTVKSHYEAKCLDCHSATPARPEGTPSSSHQVAAEARRVSARTCPVDPITGCISCHMPKVDDPSRRARFTDHHIRVHRQPAPG